MSVPTVSSRIPPAPPARETRVAATRGLIAIDWRELWDRRELLGFLVMRDLRVRYKQTALGSAWAILQPAMTVAVFWVVFGKFANIPYDGASYPLFACAGVLPWTLVAAAVTNGGMSLVNQQHLLTKVYFPRMFIPASILGAAILDFSIGMGLLLAIMAVLGQFPGFGALALLPLLVLTVCMSLGVALFLAALTVTYRDFRFVAPFLVQMWMYLSPVAYPASLVPAEYRLLASVNPAFGLITGFRSAALGLPWDLASLGVSCASALLLLAVGLTYFRAVERRFADIA